VRYQSNKVAQLRRVGLMTVDCCKASLQEVSYFIQGRTK